MSIEAAGPLSGIRVVEVADLSGAYCGKLLADLGAAVVKVEPPEGDPTRRLGPFYQDVPGPDRSLVFWHYHANQQSAVIDPRADAERWNELLTAADVLLLSGNPTALARRGLDPATLQAAQPHLIVAAIGPFGQSGPRCEWKSCDTVAQAAGGMLFVNGHAGEPPLRGFGVQAYHSASTYAAIGIVLALLARRRTQRGQLVDVSLQEAVAATVEHVSGFLQQSGAIEIRRGTLHWSRYFRVGRCRDGYVLHCSLGDWTSLLEWVKAEGGARDLAEPAWDEVDHRRRHCEHLFDVLDGWARSYAVDELVDGAQLRRIPYAPVRSLESVASHPQLEARRFFPRLAHPELGTDVTYPGAPYRFSATPWALRHAAPVSPSLPRRGNRREEGAF